MMAPVGQESSLCGGAPCGRPVGDSAGFRDKVLPLKLEEGSAWCCPLDAFLWVLN